MEPAPPAPHGIDALARELGRLGLAAGLDAVGIAPARPFERARHEIERRRTMGLHGGMAFTFRNPGRSTDPASTVPGARALVVGARSYHRRPAPAEPGPAPGRVARYSWIDHYRPLRAALQGLAEVLVEAGWRARVVADDNALVDREAAYLAGLGWYGKNSNLLLGGRGSWFVLGSVVTDAPLSPAERPVEDGCGACTSCLPACPTGALVSPGVLDARRCLAWLLQAPGTFPAEHREALGARLYGCDDCQEVCPVNRAAARRSPPGEAEPGAEAVVDVLSILEEPDDRAVLRRLGRWYVPGRQARYLRRNALVVLGNVADGDHPRVARALRSALAAGDPLVRAHAVWAAARLGRRDLLEGMDGDPDDGVRAELARLPSPREGPAPGAPAGGARHRG